MFRRSAWILLACLAASGSARADILTFSFNDPIGDQAGGIDSTGLSFLFNKNTGDYTIDVFATAANPFVGSFRININLFNRDASLAEDPGFFSDTLNDFTFAAPATQVTLTGNNARLMSWSAGDRVAVSSGAFGNPTGPSGISAFSSGVWTAGPSDLIGSTSTSLGSGNSFAVINNAVPEPSPAALAGMLGVIALAWRSGLRTLLRRGTRSA